MNNGRVFLAAGALALAALAPAHAQTAPPPAASPAPRPTLEQRLTEAASANRHRLEFDGKTFSGPAWDLIVSEGRQSQFFLLGEEHGIAENAKFAAELFRTLVPAGYTKLVIEVSPPMARELDRAARGGVGGLQKMYAMPGGEPAFFGMREESELLVAARAAVPGNAPVFWGVDYEVGGERLLISMLEKKNKPEAARVALAALREASSKSWEQFDKTRNPQFIYSFSGDPALVRAVREAWPQRDTEASGLLESLEETFEINKLWTTRKNFASNERRSNFMRRNFAQQWLAEKKAGRAPRVFAKMGASHMTRGRNMSEVYDLGNLLPEIALLEGGKTFHLLVLPGATSQIAAFNPSEWRYNPAPAKDSYAKGLEPIAAAAFGDAFTLVDLRPLRPILGTWREGTSPELMRVVHGFDAVLMMSGSKPSANLRE